MERSELLVELLGLVHAHDSEDDIFIVYPNKLAFGVIASPLSGGGDDIADKLNLLLQLNWPTGTLMQVSMYASPDLVGVTSHYKDLRRGVTDKLLRRMTDEHVDYVRRSASEPFDKSTGARLRDTKIAITVQIPYKGAVPADSDVRRCKELRVGFDQALKSAGVRCEVMNPKSYIRLMETILNQGVDSAWKQSPLTTYDDNELICTQVVDPGNAIDVDSHGIWLNGTTRVRVLAPKRYPDVVYFGMAMRYLTDPKQGARGIRENTLITMNLYFPDREGSRSKMEKDQMWSNHQSSTPISKYVKFFRDRKASLDAVLNEVGKGDRIVKGYLSMAIFTQGTGSDDKARELTEERSIAAVTNAQSYWREFGFQMLPERYMVMPFFAQLLPFASDESLMRTLERYKTMSGKHATYLLPIMGQWRGTGTPLMNLFARDGQVQSISPWDTDAGMNFMITAQTGSGKSVFAQALISSMQSIGGRSWIIDVGDSYKDLCEVMGGQYMSFETGVDICLNPFTNIVDFGEDMDYLAGIIGIMIAPTEGLNDFKTTALKKTLVQCWDELGSGMSMDDLAAALSKHDRQEVQDMGYQLHSFTSAGEYGRFFVGKNNVQMEGDLTVLELGALKEKPQLQRVVLLSLMYQISKAVYMGDRTRRQMLLIDEAWQLLASDETAEFVEKAFRQFRKHQASIGVITQSVMDVWENKGGRAMADNTSHMYLLKQKLDSIEAIQREGKLPFGEWGYEMLKTVHTNPGVYSEIMCVTPYGVGVGRLVLNNFQKVLFSTKAEDVVAIKQKRDMGMDIGEAINAIVTERFGANTGMQVAMPSPVRLAS